MRRELVGVIGVTDLADSIRGGASYSSLDENFILAKTNTQYEGDGMAALIEAIDVKRKMVFELEGVPYACLDVEVNTPTARGGQTLVRLKMRNLLTNAVFEKTFKRGRQVQGARPGAGARLVPVQR